MYQKPDPKLWHGRQDGSDYNHLRWHQGIKMMDLSQNLPIGNKATALLGFACDEGVRRNEGRAGASNGPNALRNACRNLPWHFPESFTLFDAGNIVCEANRLESAQSDLGNLVHQLQKKQYFTTIIGGGHEVLFGHYQGLRKAHPKAKIGIINFDAHFDMRALNPAIGPTSGTGFWQITQTEPLYYLVLGIQKSGNTRALFNFAKEKQVQMVHAVDFRTELLNDLITKVQDFILAVDYVYLTICLDVFAAAYAPGVSAPTAFGLIPDAIFREVLLTITRSPKLISMDIAELNPQFDEGDRTAKLAAQLLFETLDSFAQTHYSQ